MNRLEELANAYNVMNTERICVQRQGKCNRDCAECFLVMPVEDVLMAYDTALEILKERLDNAKAAEGIPWH